MNDTATKPMGPLTIVADCSIHASHEPEPTYCEIHHIIPQAWQLQWQPPEPYPYPGPSPDHAGVTLWDARTAILCRTGHGNVHYWLVKVTRAIADLKLDSEDEATWHDAVHTVRGTALAAGHAPGHADLDVAMLAIIRYAAVGGKIANLVANRLWGQI